MDPYESGNEGGNGEEDSDEVNGEEEIDADDDEDVEGEQEDVEGEQEGDDHLHMTVGSGNLRLRFGK